jgi:nicotinamide riboside transporter PnuC
MLISMKHTARYWETWASWVAADLSSISLYSCKLKERTLCSSRPSN